MRNALPPAGGGAAGGTGPRPRRSFGTIRRQRSGRYQASYVGPDSVRHFSEENYSAKADAEGWLRDERRLIEWNEWSAPTARGEGAGSGAEDGILTVGVTQDIPTFDSYARGWIESRITSKGAPLHPRTRAEYLGYLEGILESLVSRRITEISAADIARWHGVHAKTPALRHKAYSFMKSVFRTAVEVDELIERNPCRVDNASRRPKQQVKPDRIVRSVTHETIRDLADLVQPRDKALILLLAYCCLRSGEACALRRSDVQLGNGTGGLPFGWLAIERGVSSYDGQRHEGETKTGELGERVIPIPPHIVGDLERHLATWAEPGRTGLLFPSTNPAMDFRTTQQINGHAAVFREDGSIRKKGYGWYHARQVVGMPTLRLHWLRHWASTVWDEAGTPEGLRRSIMGHVQSGITGLYTHPDTTKAVQYAIRVSELAGWQSPKSPAPSAVVAPSGALATLLGTMEPAALAGILATMNAEEIGQIIPLLPPDRVAAILTSRRNETR